MNQKKVVILFFGGFDFVIVVVMVKVDGYVCYIMSFDYGQCYCVELQVVECVVWQLGVIEYKVIGFDFNGMGGLVLIDESIVVFELFSEGILVIYVLVCNMVFFLFVLGWVEVLDVCDIFIGVNVVDYFGYLDCCFEFVEVFECMVNLVIKVGVEGNGFCIQVLLQYLFKVQIIQVGVVCGVDYGLMVFCY